ncbi:hypothetical protein Tco_1110428 [Tanacetum coccineum]|uniref:MAK10-like protein n=1 Tax=Tanacetum coccineum TaxID=301880 RepID=A0ABQ5IIT7_9ASTR
MGDANPVHTLRYYSKPSHEGYRNTIELPVGNNVVPLRSDTTRLVQNGCSFHRLRSEDPNQHLKDFLKLVDSLDLDGSITTWEDLTTRFLAYSFHREGPQNFNDPMDFAKPVKEISLPQDVPSTSDHHLIELENQVQRLMEAHLALTQPTQVNKLTTLYEICSGPHDTQYCMEDLEQAFVEYASSRTDEAGEGLVSNFMASQDARLSKFQADFKQQQSEMTNKIDTLLKAITDRIAGSLPSDTSEEEEKDSPENTNTNPSASPDPSVSFIVEKVRDDGDVMFIEMVKKNDDSHKEEPKAGGLEEEYFDTFPIRSKLAYHKYLMYGPIPLIFQRNPIITEGCPSNLKLPCNIRHIMRRKLDPRENLDRGVSNFTRRIKGMHIFVGNFTYVMEFMIVEDISSIIDPRLSQVVLEKPFVDISNMTHDPPEGVVRFTNGTDEIAYKMPHKIEQYNSLSDLKKEHTKLVYLRNEEDKRRGVEYIMRKILGFYKECLELGIKYVTGMDDEGEVTFLALGWLLEEIHVTWAHLEKKRTRLRLYTKSLKKLCIQSVETASRVSSDDVRTFEVTESEIW